MRMVRVGALVIGSGCAGYAAADALFACGVTDCAVLTKGRLDGTSRNTGSDKQTYYKLSLCSDREDSVYGMAADLFAGGAMHGDTALCEAAGSVKAFMKLNLLGVPFPTNEYGEYIGYQTDHDTKGRATSVGPLTSKVMTEKLEGAVLGKGIPIYDKMLAAEILTESGRVRGVLALDLEHLEEEDMRWVCFETGSVVLCTGGPAIAYEKSVYPASQTGSTGLALRAGAAGCNLDLWQYGLASVGFRWNLSGSYQQVLPRYVSVDEGGAEREFLPEAFGSPARALDNVFLKGYQWPFDSRKAAGSSRVDLAVQREIALGRRVFLDYTKNPCGMERGFGALSDAAREYLEKSGALGETPFARLEQLNPQAAALYRRHGIDLARDRLEIAVCAQHNNGGIAVDAHWQTAVEGLYAAGEAAGTFGLARPGGTALNSTQVGAQRAAEHIAMRARQRQAAPMEIGDAGNTRRGPRGTQEMSAPPGTPGSASEACGSAGVSETAPAQTEAGRRAHSGRGRIEGRICPDAPDPMALRRRMQREMSACAAFVRDPERMEALEEEIRRNLPVRARTVQELPGAIETQDMMETQLAMLSAMRLSAAECGSRGAALVLESGQGKASGAANLLEYAYAPERDARAGFVLTTERGADGGLCSRFEPVRPLPRTRDWFETTWKRYNAAHGISPEGAE